MRLIDGARSRAVLVGASRFVDAELSDIPAVRRDLADLADVLTSPDHTNLAPQHCTVLMDEPDPTLVVDRLTTAAEQAEDALIVYYAGHASTDPYGNVHLCVPTTDPTKLSETAIPFSKVHELLAGTKAINRILILDCEFESEAIDGTYTLASTAPHTILTGELTTLLRKGHPSAPEFLTLPVIFDHLTQRLSDRDLPLPEQPGDGTADLLALSKNASFEHDPGGLTEAIELFEQLVADRMRVLGALHPDTLISRHEHAYWIGEGGNPLRAAELFSGVVAGREQALGPEHPHTLISRHNEAHWTGEAGNWNAAADLMRQVATDRTRVLGADHPDTLLSRNDFAYWTGQAGNASEAAEAFSQIVADATRVQGADHPNTLRHRHNEAEWVAAAGNPARGTELMAEVVADRDRVLGPDDPDTLLSRHSHAYWTAEAGDPKLGIDLMRKVVTDRTRVLGADDPTTMFSRHELARMIATYR
jgi:hypothetical protein